MKSNVDDRGQSELNFPVLLRWIMDQKNSKIKRPKRTQKVIEDWWDCSVCTFRNTAEAFKCLMCDVRKGKNKFHNLLGFSHNSQYWNVFSTVLDQLWTMRKYIPCVDLVWKSPKPRNKSHPWKFFAIYFSFVVFLLAQTE